MATTALITGATAGIGYELAKCFARDGHDLVLVARTEDRLNSVKEEFERIFKTKVHIHVADLAVPGTPQQVYDAMEDAKIRIDYLVNNAGFGVNGTFYETDLQSELDMMQVNMNALVALTKHFLHGMVERRTGRIMNVASTAAFQPGPYMAIYCATKSFVLSFSEAIAAELEDSGVTVTALCPGATRTEFQDRAGINEIPLVSSKFMSVMKAETVAKEGYKAMMRGDALHINGMMNRLGAQSIRFVPRSMATTIAGRLMKR